MDKKLTSLTSGEGKSPEQIAHEAWLAHIHYLATAQGLDKCKVCGGYKGLVQEGSEHLLVSCTCGTTEPFKQE